RRPLPPSSSSPLPYTPLFRSVLPREDLTVDSVVSVLTLDDWNSWIAALDTTSAELYLPKFKLGAGGVERGDPRIPVIQREYGNRSEEHTSELQSRGHLVCRLL